MRLWTDYQHPEVEKRIVLVFVMFICGIFLDVHPACAQSTSDCASTQCLYQDASAPLEQRVHDLMHRMTMEEKIAQLQDHAPAIPRLGVPEYNWWNEGLHGVARNGVATVFPQAIGLAATWNSDLVHQVADVVSTEARAKYNEAIRLDKHSRYAGITYWSPNVNIFRDPRWGRGQETYGEDPFLSARMGVAFVQGLQGNDPNYLKLSATPKHFAVHSGPEPDRHGFNVNPSKHDQEDTYLPAFRATVVEAHADAVMCAYNAVDGEPACSSSALLQERLRSLWHFQGYVVSDCDAVFDIAHGHHAQPDEAAASAAALKAGTDLNCGNAYQALPEATKRGLISEADIDRALARLLAARFRLGMFDAVGKVAFNRISIAENNTPAHRELAARTARESFVLLKNDGVLPLRNVKRILVVGPGAESLEVLEGNYNGTAPEPSLLLDGIRKRFGATAEVTYSPGSAFVDEMPSAIPSAAFRPEPGSKQNGLKAEYFNSLDFKGSSYATRIDKSINFNWSRTAPVPGISDSRFAVRWSGEFMPVAPGEYTFSFRGIKVTRNASEKDLHQEQRVAVYLDGKRLLSTHQPSAKVVFADRKPHRLRVEYCRTADDRYVQLQWQPPAKALLDAAEEAAKSADAVVAFAGLSPNLEGESMSVNAKGFNGGDRVEIGLPAPQERLLETLGRSGKPLVVVLTSGSALAVNWAAEHANAILQAWYPGEDGGNALAAVLAGDYNPAGRLPITFYRSLEDLPPFTDYSMANRTYRYFKGPVLYPFGYGLSYSQFTYRGLELSSKTLKAGEPLVVSADVTNTSSQDGDEVVQLYLKGPKAPGAPSSSLQGFKRVHLAAGEHIRVTFHLDVRQLSSVEADGRRAVLPGSYKIFVGGGQPAFYPSGESGSFDIQGAAPIPY
jgi:beta-glucosidase